ncbi:unnamed protein product [Rotaria socialis]|uniref:Uncharacterized protein n=1 Tax=Rotaria socialis TaxID=392032 RepID=A0A818EA64_9BILA|nr:unnamed protein product [Rotaria socialis]CAF4638398.1 unnamed protein product [Rotaria socialis]
MQHSLLSHILVACLLSAVPIKSEDGYGMYYYTFDNDTLTASCTKPEPLIFRLMFDFLTMVKSESDIAMEQCVLDGKGPGFTSPPIFARTIFAATTIAYNTYARYSQHAKPVTMYDEWTRMSQTQQKVPDCIYIYGFYQIANFIMPEQMTNYSFKQKYEETFHCNLTDILANADSELGLVQRDVDQLKLQLKTDGFNQDGCYADKTNFRTINPPCRFDNRSTVAICRNFTHTYTTIWNYGEIVKTDFIDSPRTPVFPQAQQARPFSLGRLYDYLAPPFFEAPAFENGTMMNLTDQFLHLIDVQKDLGADHDKPKLIAEYWADGPKTTGTPGHWQSISLNIIRRLCYDNDDALKLLFAVSAATYDAGLAAWQNKRLYNSVRPATFIPTEYIDESFQHQFVGMYCNFEDIIGWQWSPYQEDHVITPQFQEYISGHSTFSRAASFVLEKITGSPNVPGNLSVTIKAGKSLFQPQCNKSNTACYRSCRVDSSLDSENNYIPKVDVTLGPWKTYRDIANEASISRIYGGIHVASGDIQGRMVGQKVGEAVWAKVSDLFNDAGPVPTSHSNKLRFHCFFYFTALSYCYYYYYYYGKNF